MLAQKITVGGTVIDDIFDFSSFDELLEYMDENDIEDTEWSDDIDPLPIDEERDYKNNVRDMVKTLVDELGYANDVTYEKFVAFCLFVGNGEGKHYEEFEERFDDAVATEGHSTEYICGQKAMDIEKDECTELYDALNDRGVLSYFDWERHCEDLRSDGWSYALYSNSIYFFKP